MGRLEEEAWVLMERFKLSWEEVLAMTPERRVQIIEQGEEAAAAEEAPEEEAEAQPPQPVDDYVGPKVGDIVGDSRRLRIISIDPMTGEDSVLAGEAWQSESGKLNGSGIAAVMLFEPMAAVRYERISVALNISPLAALHARIARSVFMRAEMVDDGNG
jgi:hypothetical protein